MYHYRSYVITGLLDVHVSVVQSPVLNPQEDMNWKTFAGNLLLFNLIGLVGLFLLQEFQGFLPFNPEKLKAIKWDTALNTAVSFVTNTNWQPYASEKTTSYLTQMLGLGLQNFLSAATGMAVAVAFINAFIRKTTTTIGNFWVYLTRSILYILLPLAIILALVLVSQGSIDNLKPYTHIQTLEGKEQVIPQGPAASQIAIKHLGTNGGGFFAANSAHPYENPKPVTDYLEILALLIIAAAFPFTFGALTNNRTRGWTIFIAMMSLFILGLGVAIWAELHGNPLLTKVGIHHGLNMEGKEMRLGMLSAATFTDATTATSTGATNVSLNSLMPLTQLIAIFNMAIDGTAFGGVGVGLINMLFYTILTMFLIGLMIGRSPEIYGKKLDPYEMIIIIIALLLPGILKLALSTTALSANVNILGAYQSPHRLSEIIYTYVSTVANNGSQLVGLNFDLPFYNLTTALAMLAGRFITIISALAIAGSIVEKKINPPSARFPTTNLLFVIVLSTIVLIVGALTFFPALVLGPVLEHLYIFSGQTF